MCFDLASAKPGDALPPRTFGPIARAVLALFAGGSGDHNPIHIDPDVARAAGHPDVIAPGMLSMAYLAQYVMSFAPQSALRSYSARFTAITPVNAFVVCSGSVLNVDEDGRQVRLGLRACINDGLETVAGQAVTALR